MDEFLKHLTSSYNLLPSSPYKYSIFYDSSQSHLKRIENNKYGYVRSADATISKTELKPGEAVEINLAITSTFPSRWEDQDVIATVSYELQGETRYFYFIIKYRGWDNE